MPPRAKPAAPPSPPRVIVLMEAPTNALVASFFAKLGYSVELVIDLRYCSTPLLKQAKYIVLGPNPDKSPFYDKIRATLIKMVPDRLFEQQGPELLLALREKEIPHAQKTRSSHPSDTKLKTEKREKEDKAVMADVPKPSPMSPPSADMMAQGTISSMLLQTAPEDSLESMAAPLLKASPEETKFSINDEMELLIRPYLNLQQALGTLEAQRQSILMQEDMDEKAVEELKKQQGPINKPLPPARALAKWEQFQKQVEQASEQGKEFPPRKLPERDLFDHVIELGTMTDALVAERARLQLEISKAFAHNVCKDRFYRIATAVGANCDNLHGLLYFYLTLQAYRYGEQAKLKSAYKKWQPLLKEKQQASGKKAGGFSLFKKKSDESEEEESGDSPEFIEATGNLSKIVTTLTILDSELSGYDKMMADGFWSVYEQLCGAILQDKVKNKTFMRYIRSFLRFGLMSDHPAMISKAQSSSLLNMCDEDLSNFKHEHGRTNIIYVDESLIQMREGIIPPSFDEELELEGQGTPKYKYDKASRKIYASKFKIVIYEREKAKWGAKIAEQKKALESGEAMLAEHEKGTKEYKVIQTGNREAKSEVSRVSKIVEKLDQVIETEQGTIETQEAVVQDLGYTPNPMELCSNEAKTVRKFCKLLANLKEPFFPFILRDSYKPEAGLFDRKTVAEGLKGFEGWDENIFSTDLANAQNPRKQVMVRFSPTMILYPVMGTMGFCVAPSNAADTGRLVLPIMPGQQAPLDRMLIDMFADFRYDTAKENAGVDLMTSDTICAAYAKVRWDYRKKGKEFREKAGIYNDMQDKKNFKVHYRLYIESMDEAGKKLFFKCYEMYEGFAKYIPVPRGMQKLSKN